jgi:CCR4-NOT transcription complex subunit 2
MQPPALKTGHLAKFQLETLFYIFYALPKDVLQAYSAQELYTREWRYNGELKTWFMRVTTPDSVANLSNNSNAPQYLYFDVNSWERRLFNGNIQNITNGFLSEEDVRVKFPSS